METDLTSILKSSQALTDDHCQFFLYQILRGMKSAPREELLKNKRKKKSAFKTASSFEVRSSI